jgi:endonuclease/exonuclease/phosphatase family metal-dependent hydrolase
VTLPRRAILVPLAGIALVLLLIWATTPATSLFHPPDLEQSEQPGFTVLTANVGNGDPRCVFQRLKLCRSEVEARLTESLAELRPEVVALQETLPDHLCEGVPPVDNGHVCSEEYAEPQVRRLLGLDYSIVCEESNFIECIGVRTDVGEILGCELGALCTSSRVVTIAPGCRTHLTVFAATVKVSGRTFDIVNAHPENRSAECRLDSLQQVFEGDLIREDEALVLGDLNLDPWRGDDVSTEYWNTQVGPSHAFYYHSGPAEQNPPHPTIFYPLFRRTLDHVVSNFLAGSLLTLGEAEGSVRLDGGGGTDHRALFGRLTFPEER